MSKSPVRDYTAMLQQSRTKKKQEIMVQEQSRNHQRYSYVSRKLNDASSDDTRTKFQLALRHNTRLLDQNATLSQMANSLRFQLKNFQDDVVMIKRQHEDLMKSLVKQRQNLEMQRQIKSANHEQQLRKLLEQISELHEQKNRIQIQKDKQIEQTKGEFEKGMLTQMQNLRNVQNNAKELYEVQINRLKEELKTKQVEFENSKALERIQKNRLKDQATAIQNQLKHLRQKFQVEGKEAKREFQKDLASQKRRAQTEKQLQAGALALKIKRLKKQLVDKAQDLQSVSKRMYQQEQTNQLESMGNKKDKQNLLSQLTNNQVIFKTTLMKEKTKLEELSRLEVQNLTNLYETNIQQLQGEVNRLRLLIDCKTEQIKDSYEENKRIKLSYGDELELYRAENHQLKDRLKSSELQFREQEQAVKVKLALLIQTNVNEISNYYQKELANLSIHNREVSGLNKDLKDRIYKLIQDNDDLRKTFQIQVSKYKARIQDFKIKLASLGLQHRQHVGSLSSKVQMTSQTLIREGQTKERSKVFYEQEKRKFYALANQKDKQIAEMMQSIKATKQMHEDELKVASAERDSSAQEIQRLQAEKRRIKQSFEMEIAGKDERLKTLKYDNQKQLEEIKDLQARLHQAEKQTVKLKKTLDHFNLLNQSLAQELGLKKGFIQTMQLESNAAIEEQKTKIRVLMGAHQVTLKEYFEEKLKSKNQDVESLQRKLIEKQEDIRTLILKYNALEKRFDMAMDAQEKLTDFEQKIRQLGLDNNLVKNMAQLFKKKA